MESNERGSRFIQYETTYQLTCREARARVDLKEDRIHV